MADDSQSYTGVKAWCTSAAAAFILSTTVLIATARAAGNASVEAAIPVPTAAPVAKPKPPKPKSIMAGPSCKQPAPGKCVDYPVTLPIADALTAKMDCEAVHGVWSAESCPSE
jgi:hypothetical protein